MSNEAVESKLSQLDVAESAPEPALQAEPEPAEAQAAEKREVADRKVVAKFLVSNAAAGSIIGKAGASISELQSQSGARLQLSRANEFFPGTTDRVVLTSGTVNQVLTALHLVLTKIQGEQAVAESMMARDGKSTQLRLLVPAALCGAVIGKGGATIRGFAEDSKAAITVSSQDKQPPGVLDRVVRVTGGPEQLLRAVALLLTKLAENPNYARFTSATVSYAAPAVGPAVPAAAYAASLPAVPTGGSGPKGQQRVEVTVPVPEGRVGAVIGKGGEVISQLKSVVGVKIRISDREDFVPGTRNRKVTISGTADAVQIAQVLIHQKVHQTASGAQ
ncbi:hypothetical protein WJX81_007706 [Elliptochloris bilobata]|uniref:K Homology domain-containing protein n=1 Tax=Elliptochloris bilobata TaxID=381761 RepID=A0AAW1QN63_9CHLO